jgi:DNA-binding CsgD family transcriptional regulator
MVGGDVLTGCTRFVDAAVAVCDASARRGTKLCGIMLHSTSGQPVLTVDNGPFTDEHRLFVVTRPAWVANPIFAILGESLAGAIDPREVAAFVETARAHGMNVEVDHAFLAPLVCPQGWCGTVVWGKTGAFSATLERELAMLATRLSVWCTEHGVGLIPGLAHGELGPQQCRVARLAARGSTNPEIAGTLRISVNTVKLRLKQVFERLGVANRTELAHMLLRLAPADEVSVGITHLARATVTRTEPGRPLKVPGRGLDGRGPR